ncbi:MAG: hypothetical protein RL442_26 [Pseudomonadota bacterium]|jgi:hypothetical protein
MFDYSILPNEDDEGIVLKKARTKSKGGMLTDTVRPGDASALPNAIASYRKRATDLYQQGSDLYNADPDISQLQEYAKTRGSQGEASMLNALAAQFAGEGFQPVQTQYLKRAAAAQEPMKVGGGMLTDQGQFIKDPFAAQDKRAEFLLQQAKAYESLAQTAATAQERAEATRAQNEMLNQFRQMQLQFQGMNAETSRMNANTARMMAGNGTVGSGNATQIGSGANNEPIFRQPNGQLFTYDQNAKPVPFQGQISPKATNAQPTEDERKAAGWYFQADNARRNMANVINKNPKAAYPTVPERMAGFIPGVGTDIQNSLRPEDRQKFVQAAGSMSEALLRAATGAGINAYEADQKVKELVPQLGDKPGTVQQKMDAYEVYMNSLRTRAGRAIPNNPAPGAAPAAPANADPLGLRKPGGR